ncbi:DNA repair protein RecN [Desulfosarcina sp.]|uniref:DNA repair protein RecN n=1 Tax=Desulfosarcina sp. TaxID=2027861 RepID=UPI0029B9C00E|nr:DNA repair protein RecN [Desulfosarcina sp.]MDX2451867.1 DNA repair protein RecN [Desulfosarcina sp.]MDX2489657.1 DNA repair protein RecN [Desulfosarcina sp.]
MLKELLIKNFAIIDDLNIRFDGGLTILSGETGAGKSIIINAVNLLLGSRVNARMIRDGYETAELSAFFDVPEGSTAAAIMAENGYDPQDGLLVRRIISGNDRHRIYINDRMATMQMLTSITADLASISGQHVHQGLIREETHLTILDRFGGLSPRVRQVSDLHGKIVTLVQALQVLEEKKKNQDKQMDLLRYQAAEIANADIMPGEDESLEKERLRLKHAESLHHSVFSAIETLHGADGAILEQLGEVRKNLEKAADIDDGLAAGVRSLSDHLFGLEDVTDSLRAYLGSLDTEADRLESVETRLDLINKLKRKYGGSLETLFQKRDAIEVELAATTVTDDDIQRSETQLNDYYDQVSRLARSLSEERTQVASDFAESVEKELEGLKMAGTRFGVSLSPLPCSKPASPWLRVDDNLLSATGIDQAAFMIAPNVGESLKPLASIASGGELSRVVLALKAILAETDAVGTVIFDEVDAGIGGAVADVVGKKLEALSKKHQLICITHLPQIARFGDQHYYIEKQVKNGRTATTIRPMDQEDRIKEIARMLGGEIVTRTALEHARTLMER